MKFLVVNLRSAYHEVLGRPALKELWVIIAIHYLCMKFPTEWGIAIVQVIRWAQENVTSSPWRRLRHRSKHVALWYWDVWNPWRLVISCARGRCRDVRGLRERLTWKGSHRWVGPSSYWIRTANHPSGRTLEFSGGSPGRLKSPASREDLGEKGKIDLKDFLCKNSDVFAWKHEDIIGIDPKVSCHRL